MKCKLKAFAYENNLFTNEKNASEKQKRGKFNYGINCNVPKNCPMKVDLQFFLEEIFSI